MSEVVSVRVAAEMIGVHPNTIRNWIDAGELPYEQRGTFRLPLWSAVEQRLTSARFAASDKIVAALLTAASELEDEARRLRHTADLLRASHEDDASLEDDDASEDDDTSGTRRRWTNADDRWLFTDASDEDVARALGRTVAAVRGRRHKARKLPCPYWVTSPSGERWYCEQGDGGHVGSCVGGRDEREFVRLGGNAR